MVIINISSPRYLYHLATKFYNNSRSIYIRSRSLMNDSNYSSLHAYIVHEQLGILSSLSEPSLLLTCSPPPVTEFEDCATGHSIPNAAQIDSLTECTCCPPYLTILQHINTLHPVTIIGSKHHPGLRSAERRHLSNQPRDSLLWLVRQSTEDTKSTHSPDTRRSIDAGREFPETIAELHIAAIHCVERESIEADFFRDAFEGANATHHTSACHINTERTSPI